MLSRDLPQISPAYTGRERKCDRMLKRNELRFKIIAHLHLLDSQGLLAGAF